MSFIHYKELMPTQILAISTLYIEYASVHIKTHQHRCFFQDICIDAQMYTICTGAYFYSMRTDAYF